MITVAKKRISLWKVWDNLVPHHAVSVLSAREHETYIWSTVQRSRWSSEEDAILRQAVAEFGAENQWQLVANRLPGRSNKNCRQRWLHSLSPTLRRGRWTPDEDDLLREAYRTHGPAWSKVALEVGRTDDQCAKRWRENLDPGISSKPWTQEEDQILLAGYAEVGSRWKIISSRLVGRPTIACRNRYRGLTNLKRLEAKLDRLASEREMSSDGTSSSFSRPSSPSRYMESSSSSRHRQGWSPSTTGASTPYSGCLTGPDWKSYHDGRSTLSLPATPPIPRNADMVQVASEETKPWYPVEAPVPKKPSFDENSYFQRNVSYSPEQYSRSTNDANSPDYQPIRDAHVYSSDYASSRTIRHSRSHSRSNPYPVSSVTPVPPAIAVDIHQSSHSPVYAPPTQQQLERYMPCNPTSAPVEASPYPIPYPTQNYSGHLSCPSCSFTTTHPTGLWSHVSQCHHHSGPRPTLPCPGCSYVAPDMPTLWHHISGSHLGLLSNAGRQPL